MAKLHVIDPTDNTRVPFLRALIRHVCAVCEDDLKQRSIPTAKPLLLELDGDLTVSSQRHL